jgi:hypothetical protein
MMTDPFAARFELAQRDGQRFRCRAMVGRFGRKPGKLTIMFRDVTEVATGYVMTDHLWFTCGKWSDGLTVGDLVEFDARAADYIKGYQGRRHVPDAPVRKDWKLQRPTKVTRIAPGAGRASVAEVMNPFK